MAPLKSETYLQAMITQLYNLYLHNLDYRNYVKNQDQLSDWL